MKTFYLEDNFSVLLVGDAHQSVTNINRAKINHPECSLKIFMGDLGDFIDPARNHIAYGWMERNIEDYIFLLGNHERESYHRNLNITFEQKKLIESRWYISIKLKRPDEKYYVLCHSKPKDLWSFMNPGAYTFREFTEDFACAEDENCIACISAHVHRPAKHVFQETDVELWQIGAIKDKKYAILTEKGIEFKKL